MEQCLCVFISTGINRAESHPCVLSHVMERPVSLVMFLHTFLFNAQVTVYSSASCRVGLYLLEGSWRTCLVCPGFFLVEVLLQAIWSCCQCVQSVIQDTVINDVV